MENPIDFCAHLVREILAGTKTMTWKPKRAGEPSPFGQAGDTLVVRGWRNAGHNQPIHIPETADDSKVRYAKIFLDVISVEEVSLQDLDDENAARAAGLPSVVEFRRQWDGIYRSPYTWNENPKVWRVTFRRR